MSKKEHPFNDIKDFIKKNIIENIKNKSNKKTNKIKYNKKNK